NYVLWKCGIQHRDPSANNLMFRRLPDETLVGVLNDWDLANIEGSAPHTGLERTGTIPFMALELLRNEYWTGNIERRYEHDL
ncbi:hypothetical protein BV25DRAFT_1788258, partial [Artomyces pyxidatus]